MSERLKNIVWLIVILVAFTIFSAARGGTSAYLDFGEEKLTVTAPENYTYVVDYNEIDNIELVDEFEPGTMVSGGETRKYQWGTFESDSLGQYSLCISKKIDNAILITIQDGSLFIFNYESEETTEALITMFKDLLVDKKVS